MPFCPRLPDAVSTLDWAQIADFSGALELPLTYQGGDLSQFREGQARVGWDVHGLRVHARLADDCIFTQATADHQPMWKLGDVFEIFLKLKAQSEYYEFHVVPSGYRLQLRFPNSSIVDGFRDGTKKLSDYVDPSPLFDFLTRTTAGGWEVLARVPSTTLGVASLAGHDLQASFSRYDSAGEGTKPVLSSTSPHAELNFHCIHEWTVLEIRD